MRSFFGRGFRKQKQEDDELEQTCDASSSPPESDDVRNSGFPLVPDDYHLRHVGKTVQGNGYWIDIQLAAEKEGTRDFVAAYVFDKSGNLIFCEVVDRGIRSNQPDQTLGEIVRKLEKKIDAKEIAEILVKPFATTFYGYTFGLVVRDVEDGEEASGEALIDAMPGCTLMFYGPWSHCNYDT